jgi:hypothetical protein
MVLNSIGLALQAVPYSPKCFCEVHNTISGRSVLHGAPLITSDPAVEFLLSFGCPRRLQKHQNLIDMRCDRVGMLVACQ